MFPTILNTFYWALRSQRLHSRPFLRSDQSRGLPHLPCLLLNSVLLRSMPVGKMNSECNTSKLPFFRKFGINNYSEYSDLIFQHFCKGLYHFIRDYRLWIPNLAYPFYYCAFETLALLVLIQLFTYLFLFKLC